MRPKCLLAACSIVTMLTLQSCAEFWDFLAGYQGSLTSPTVGDMLYIEAAGDSFRFGKPYGPHNVSATITYNFLVSETEVTNRMFGEFIDDNGYTTQAYWTTAGWNFINGVTNKWPFFWLDTDISPDQPVVGISWHEAVAFTQWLSIKEGWPPAYDADGRIIDLLEDGYRLPTELEWEYVASKGDPAEPERLYAWGNSWHCGKLVSTVAPCNIHSFVQDVGSKSPAGDTPRGLSDMSGNAAEFTSDTYNEPIPIEPTVNRYIFDPQQSAVMHRGGRLSNNSAASFETSQRAYINMENRFESDVGFRVVRTYPIQ